MSDQPYDWRKYDGPQFFTRVPLEEKVSAIDLHAKIPLSMLGVGKVNAEVQAIYAQMFADRKDQAFTKALSRRRLWAGQTSTSRS